MNTPLSLMLLILAVAEAPPPRVCPVGSHLARVAQLTGLGGRPKRKNKKKACKCAIAGPCRCQLYCALDSGDSRGALFGAKESAPGIPSPEEISIGQPEGVRAVADAPLRKRRLRKIAGGVGNQFYFVAGGTRVVWRTIGDAELFSAKPDGTDRKRLSLPGERVAQIAFVEGLSYSREKSGAHYTVSPTGGNRRRVVPPLLQAPRPGEAEARALEALHSRLADRDLRPYNPIALSNGRGVVYGVMPESKLLELRWAEPEAERDTLLTFSRLAKTVRFEEIPGTNQIIAHLDYGTFQTIVELDLATRGMELITPLQPSGGALRVAPDGRHLLFTVATGFQMATKHSALSLGRPQKRRTFDLYSLRRVKR